MLLLTVLLVYASSFPFMRLGRQHDGGYVIANLPIVYDTFISGGIADDLSFEQAFLTKYSNITCHAFDHTITKLPLMNPRLQWHRTKIASHTLDTYLENAKNAFVKMDIEGSEFEWLDSETHLNSIAQLVIEFHTTRSWTHYEYNIFKKLTQTHRLVHLHGNNHGKTIKIEGIAVPLVFECTYVRKDIELSESYNKDPIPGPFDQPCSMRSFDIDLNYPPFVN